MPEDPDDLAKPPVSSSSDDGNVPNLFATIYWRSAERPSGYTADEVELLNMEANRHIPELYEELKKARAQRLEREGRLPKAEPK